MPFAKSKLLKTSIYPSELYTLSARVSNPEAADFPGFLDNPFVTPITPPAAYTNFLKNVYRENASQIALSSLSSLPRDHKIGVSHLDSLEISSYVRQSNYSSLERPSTQKFSALKPFPPRSSRITAWGHNSPCRARAPYKWVNRCHRSRTQGAQSLSCRQYHDRQFLKRDKISGQ